VHTFPDVFFLVKVQLDSFDFEHVAFVDKLHTVQETTECDGYTADYVELEKWVIGSLFQHFYLFFHDADEFESEDCVAGVLLRPVEPLVKAVGQGGGGNDVVDHDEALQQRVGHHPLADAFPELKLLLLEFKCLE